MQKLNTSEIFLTAKNAIAEDIGTGDLTAALLDQDKLLKAFIISREDAVLCGIPWVNAAIEILDEKANIVWGAEDGEKIKEGQVICEISGNASAILSGERTFINFLQTLSGTATTTAEYVSLIDKSSAIILDTRKTIPGLRTAQKYAVRCGGGQNHRKGLFDGILIKENHISAAGSITVAVQKMKESWPSVPIEVEVENLKELEEAIKANADIVLLDNFSIELVKKAIKLNKKNVKIEISGNITKDTIKELAKLKVDYISIGALTKHVRAIDFSMQLK